MEDMARDGKVTGKGVRKLERAHMNFRKSEELPIAGVLGPALNHKSTYMTA